MNNKLPQVSFVFDRRRVATPTIKGSVDMRICYNYKQKFIATGVKLNSTQWKNGKIINCPDLMQISQILDKMLTDVRQIILDMMQKGKIDIMAITEELERKNKGQITFIEYCNQRSEIRKYSKKKDTKERHDRFLRLFNGGGRLKNLRILLIGTSLTMIITSRVKV